MNVYIQNPAAGEISEEDSEKAIRENEEFLEQFRIKRPLPLEEESDE